MSSPFASTLARACVSSWIHFKQLPAQGLPFRMCRAAEPPEASRATRGIVRGLEKAPAVQEAADIRRSGSVGETATADVGRRGAGCRRVRGRGPAGATFAPREARAAHPFRSAETATLFRGVPEKGAAAVGRTRTGGGDRSGPLATHLGPRVEASGSGSPRRRSTARRSAASPSAARRSASRDLSARGARAR